MENGYEPVEMDRQDVTKRRPRKGIRGGGGITTADTCEIITNTLLCCWLLDAINS